MTSTPIVLGLGTSILWGQGLRESDKLHSRFADKLSESLGSRVRRILLAHSGADVEGDPSRRPSRLHGEVPTAYPSVRQQIADCEIPGPGEKVVTLLDGGINDVGVFDIINPLISAAEIEARTKRACGEQVSRALADLATKYPESTCYLVGYYQIIAGSATRGQLANLIETHSIASSSSLKSVDIVGRVVENCAAFLRVSDEELAGAANRANQRTELAVEFSPSGFSSENGLFGDDCLLHEPFEIDAAFSQRSSHCLGAFAAGRTGLHCFVAGVGHPNAKGVARYLHQLVALGAV